MTNNRAQEDSLNHQVLEQMSAKDENQCSNKVEM